MFNVITISVLCSTSRMRVKWMSVWVGVSAFAGTVEAGDLTVAVRARTGVADLWKNE